MICITPEFRRKIDNYYKKYLVNKADNFHYFTHQNTNYCLECKPKYEVELKDID
jgi:hypothetical protein